jgi:hypothetical protein
MINRKSVLFLVLVITSVVTKEVGSDGRWVNRTAKIGSERKVSRTRKFSERDPSSSDEYFTILPTQNVQLGAMVPYLPVPSVVSFDELQKEQSSKNSENTEMSTTTKRNVKLSKTASKSNDEHPQLSKTITRSQLSISADSMVTASSQLIELTETRPIDQIVTTPDPGTKTVFHEKTYYISEIREVTVTSTVQELFTLTIYKDEPTLISLDLMDKIEQLINRIAKVKLESQERPQASEEKKNIDHEGVEELRKLEVIQKSLQISNDLKLVNEPPDDGTEDISIGETKDISMGETVNISFPFSKTLETEDTYTFEPTAMVSFIPESEETIELPFPSPFDHTPKSLSRKSVKDILNQLPSRKAMIEPQFQDHNRNPDINHIPQLLYNKPKLHWLNNNTPGHETQLEDIEKSLGPIIQEDDTYEVSRMNGPLNDKNISRDEIEALISSDEATLLPGDNSTIAFSYFENEIIINGNTTIITSETTFETPLPTNLSNSTTYFPSSPFIIDETPSNVNAMFNVGYQEMAAKTHHKHHRKKTQTKLDFEDIYNLESFAWTQAPCLSSYFAGIVLIVFLIS